MKATTFKAAVLAGSLGLLAGSASGQGLSDPVGYYTKTFLANSDTSLSLGLLRPEFGSVTIDTVGATALINETLIAGELAFAAGTQTNTYMLLVTSGSKLGAYYTITTNGANDLTLDYLGDSVTTELDGQSGKIIPYWTLNTLFPAGAGLHLTEDPLGGNFNSRVYFKDMTYVGVNEPPLENYVYIDGAAAGIGAANSGFYDPGNLGGGIVGDTVILFPDEFVTVRHPATLTLAGGGTAPATDTALTVTGDVLVDSVRIAVTTNGAAAGQDVPVGIPYPVSLSLDSLQLAAVPQTAAFENTLDPLGGIFKDRLYVLDDATAAVNKPPLENYVYIDGVAAGFGAAATGWYDPGNLGGGIVGADTSLIPANNGLILRKVSTATVTADWTFTSPYTP